MSLTASPTSMPTSSPIFDNANNNDNRLSANSETHSNSSNNGLRVSVTFQVTANGILVVVGSVVLCCVIIAFAFWYRRRQKRLRLHRQAMSLRAAQLTPPKRTCAIMLQASIDSDINGAIQTPSPPSPLRTTTRTLSAGQLPLPDTYTTYRHSERDRVALPLSFPQTRAKSSGTLSQKDDNMSASMDIEFMYGTHEHEHEVTKSKFSNAFSHTHMANHLQIASGTSNSHLYLSDSEIERASTTINSGNMIDVQSEERPEPDNHNTFKL